MPGPLDRAKAGTRAVPGNHTIAVGKRLELVASSRGSSSETVHENQRRSVALFAIGNLYNPKINGLCIRQTHFKILPQLNSPDVLEFLDR